MRVANICNNSLVGFLGKDVYLCPGGNITAGDIKRESAQAKRAKKHGVNTPEYTTIVSNGQDILKYTIKGEAANPKTNAISKKHLKNLFKNLYLMDKAGIFHCGFDKSGVFLENGGGVEFNCFRYSQNFAKKPNAGALECAAGGAIADTMPSNEMVFEEQYLSKYVEGIENGAQKRDFVKNYLKEKSHYHQKRADMLVTRGFAPSSQAVEYENVQSEALKNPSDKVVSYMMEKLEFLYQKQSARSEWLKAEGTSGCDADGEMRINSVNTNFDCLLLGIALKEKAQNTSKGSEDKALKEYFALEAESMAPMLQDIFCDIKEKGALNFNDVENGIYLGTQEEKHKFTALCANIDLLEDRATLETQVAPAKDFYGYLSIGWNLDLSNYYKAKYQECA